MSKVRISPRPQFRIAGPIASPTQIKFGYPDTLIAEYHHWCVLLRQAQATLGAMVLVCTDEAHQFADISPAAFSELGTAVGHLEAASKAFRPWQKINYLMLMMVDPDVHFHVLPRYDGAQAFKGVTFTDNGWPGPPDLGGAVTVDGAVREALIAEIKSCWPRS